MLTRALGATRHVSAGFAAALATALSLSVGEAQSPPPPSEEVVVARVDSLVRAYMADKAPASISVAISRGSEMLVQRAWGVGTGRCMAGGASRRRRMPA